MAFDSSFNKMVLSAKAFYDGLTLSRIAHSRCRVPPCGGIHAGETGRCLLHKSSGYRRSAYILYNRYGSVPV